MLRASTPRVISLFNALFFLFLFSITNISCSTDSLEEVGIVDKEESTDTEESQEDSNDTDVTNPSDTNEFEESFVLDEDKKLVNFVLSDVEYNKFITDDGDLKVVTKKVYQYFNDEFDFIFILSVEESQPQDLYYGISYKAKNDIQGIGSSTYDGTASYGSQGKLKSVIYMPRTEYIVSGPFLHEIAHYWANHGFLSTTVGGHWGYSSAGGQLGGFDELDDLGNGTYHGKVNGREGFGSNANGGNSLPYSNVELYVMGLIDKDELESIQVAENPVSTGEYGKFTADRIITVTSEDLVAEHGERIPSVQDSQKEFKALTVIISTSKLAQEKIDSINKDLENFARKGEPDSYWGNTYNFWKATGEKASIEIQVANENIK
ncbi:hypothetical protein [Flagellimonas pacifica]|uniref:Uncharacterized protein n=1 Tax=Flagellimonas pacifica TaxID=1247520 RepID=A0A285N1Z1_9FLAO|nr:hypothetical protein [Allomuricauda parva]SNZ02036.1 hypothetical protein SAMN06265377_3894 [Allomuricauda parva]